MKKDFNVIHTTKPLFFENLDKDFFYSVRKKAYCKRNDGVILRAVPEGCFGNDATHYTESHFINFIKN